MKVLIGVDGAEDGFAAVRQVGRLLAAERDQLAFYYTPPDLQSRDATPEVLARARRALAEGVFAESREHLDAALAAGLHTIVGTTAPSQGLLLAADEWKADLVAVGARGLGPIEKLLLGSVSRAVVHQARVPVLVARARPEARRSEPLRVLLACDGSESSRQAGQLLNQLTFPSDAAGFVATVIEAMLAGAVPKWLEDRARNADSEAMAQAWVREHEAEKQAKHAELVEYCGCLPALFRAHDPIVCEGHAAEQLLGLIQKLAVDLAVVGAHGKGALERLLIGSTSDKLLNHAPCSVLIVREHKRP